MNKEEKMEIIADILEVDMDELKEDMFLDEMEAWDSVAILSVIAVMNDKFNRYPMAEEIKSYKTVADLLKSME